MRTFLDSIDSDNDDTLSRIKKLDNNFELELKCENIMQYQFGTQIWKPWASQKQYII